ncbi:ATP-binding protein [Pleionea sp. CnH1-48]|uniref:ATP-binding protein n=1 Tax=Pleionea sp. CnH1-48 TaxID=2954494 RepID=UPI002097BC06|nr:ATP-binding protein [Pleionea sp. CnH1-48]MCO7222932.1 ATP-binding protein [Pleionea sp. CnH1-48]
MDTLVFKHFTTLDGLGSNIIRALYQDEKGMIWIGTDSGIYRYNGRSFQAIYSEQIEASKSAIIWDIAQTPNGDLWFATQNDGVFRYSPRSGHFKQYSADVTPSFQTNTVRGLLVDRSGQLWLGTRKGLHRFDKQTETFLQILDKDEHSEAAFYANFFTKMVEAPDGTLWMGTGQGLVHFNPVDQSMQRFVHDENDPHSVMDNAIYALHLDGHKLWLANDTGLGFMDLNTLRFQRVRKKGTPQDKYDCNSATTALMADNSLLWVGNYNGSLCLLDPETLESRYFGIDKSDKLKLQSSNVSDILKTRDGDIWLATHSGISVVNHAMKGVEVFSLKDKTELRQVLDINFEQQPIIFTPQGRYRFDNNHQLVEHQSLGDVIETVISHPTQGSYFTYYGAGRSLYHYDPQSHAVTLVADLSKRLRYPLIKNFMFFVNRDGKDKLWLYSSRVLIEVDLQTHTVTELTQTIPDDTTLFSVAQAGEGIWMCSFRGQLHQLSQQGHFEPVTVHALPEQSRTCDIVGAGDGGTLWLHRQHEFYQLNTDDLSVLSSFRTERKADVLYDSGDDVWLVSDGDMSRYYKKDQRLLHYYLSEYDVFKNNSYNFRWLDASNTMMVPYDDRLVRIDADVVPKPWPPIEVNLVDFDINGRHVDLLKSEQASADAQITYTQSITLPYQRSKLQVDFSGMYLNHPESLYYRYTLDGFFDEWIETTHQETFAIFTGLIEGEYLFRVQATLDKNNWSGPERQLKITVYPPLWRTWWAYLTYALLLLLGIYGWMRYRLRKVNEHTATLKHLVSERTQEIEQQKQTIEALLERKNVMFANISHEFRTPLTLIIGPLSQLTAQRKELGEILSPVVNNAKRMLRMVEQLLDVSRLDAAVKMEASVIDMSHLVHKTLVNMNSLFADHELNLEIDVDDELYILIPQDSAEKILVNLLSNAVKFTKSGGVIRVSLKQHNNRVNLVVEDTGCGIELDDQQRIFERFTRLEQTASGVSGTGIGLALVKELVQACDGTIQLTSEPEVGSRFEVSFACQSQPGSGVLEHWTESGNSLRIEMDALQTHSIEASADTDNEDKAADLPKVLVIEDHHEMRSYLHNILRSKFHCEMAVDGQEGVQKAIESTPDLIITDLMMPNKSGLEVAQILRQDIRTSHIPIVLLTAKGDQESRMDAWRTEIDEFIEKPFDHQELLLRCRNLLSIRKLLSQRWQTEVGDSSEPSYVGLRSRDKHFIEQLQQVVEQEFSNSELNAGLLSHLMNVSESQLQRKIKALLNQSIPEYVRLFRIRKAAALLQEGAQISQVAFDVGFSSASYFSSCFKAHYGLTPRQYHQKHKVPHHSES